MKKMIFLSALVLFFCAGCTTSICRHYPDRSDRRTASGQKVVATIRGENYGYFLFNSIPIWCGSPRYPNEGAWRLWRNLVREKDMRQMLVTRSKLLKADGIEEYSYAEKSSGLWSLGILWCRSGSASCIAVKGKTGKAKKSLLKIK